MGIKAYFDEYRLNRAKFSIWKNALAMISSVPSIKLIDTEALACLVIDYGVLA